MNRQCSECHGLGGHAEVIVDGMGPWEPCWACDGTGEMTPKQLSLWLWFKRQDKRDKVARAASREQP
jgi:hypothetical protein